MTEPAPPRPEPRWLMAAGLGVGCLGAVLLAVTGAFLTPYRIGPMLVPVSLLLVVAGLVALMRFTHAVTSHAGLGLLPGVVWLLLSLIFSARTSEGDIVLLESNWVSIVYLLLGSVTIGVVAYRMVIPRH